MFVANYLSHSLLSLQNCFRNEILTFTINTNDICELLTDNLSGNDLKIFEILAIRIVLNY
jgi:hypothetical protein